MGLSLPQSLLNFVVGSIVADGLADQLGLQLVDDVHPVDVLPTFDRGEEVLGLFA